MAPPWSLIAVSAAVLVVSLKPEYSIRQSYFCTAVSFVAVTVFCQFVYRSILYPDFLSPLRHIPTPKVIRVPRLSLSLAMIFWRYEPVSIQFTHCVFLGPIVVQGQFEIHFPRGPRRPCPEMDQRNPQQRSNPVLYGRKCRTSHGHRAQGSQ